MPAKYIIKNTVASKKNNEALTQAITKTVDVKETNEYQASIF